MREILFRGKRVDNGEWMEGDLIQSRDKTYIHPKANSFRVSETGLSKLIVLREVYPETVGEYTGLTDKNGKKIFEGDILQDKFGQIKIVDYSDEWGAFRTCFVRALNDEGKIVATVGGASFVGTIWRKYEVIGNIHDNPELLEVKNERV